MHVWKDYDVVHNLIEIYFERDWFLLYVIVTII